MLLRQLTTMKRVALTMQTRRSYLFVERLEKTNEDGDRCGMKVAGYLRGRAMDVNGLMHVPGYGEFQIQQVDVLDNSVRAIDK
jgi:pre-rRNA-processing protein TSR1